jgi:Uma2 family endonuclease
MSAAAIQPQVIDTVADLLARLGSIPPERIRFHPYPGTATEADVCIRPGGEKRLVELVDGVLVEKPRGYYESLVAAVLIRLLGTYAEEHDLGIVLGADATLRLWPGLVRLPDVSFIDWSRFPNRDLPAGAILGMAPDLAVEVLSEGNTEAEMERKLHEYFHAGVRLVWYVDPEKQSARVYRSPVQFQELSESDILDGEDVVPGFRLSIREWLARAGRRGSSGS